MQFSARHAVSGILPILGLALCHTFGGADPAVADALRHDSTAAIATPVNGAPLISGDIGAYARVAVPYVFQPTVSDPDGDRLTFTATNLPPWARLDPKTGRLIGTPNASDVGEYESVVIAVADATHVAKTATFAITVLPPITGVASLQWEVPASRLDGSPLDDLAGYHIFYGRNPEDLDQSVFVEGAAQTNYELAGLEGGVWYFAVAAVSADGLEGPPSIASMKSI